MERSVIPTPKLFWEPIADDYDNHGISASIFGLRLNVWVENGRFMPSLRGYTMKGHEDGYILQDDAVQVCTKYWEEMWKQEVENQKQLAASSQLPSKNNGPENVLDFYKGCGIEVIGEANGNKIFLDVRLPDGWSIKPTEHPMWRNLVDNNGCERARIFYDAFLGMHSRYYISFDKNKSNNDLWRYNAIDRKTGNVIKAEEWDTYNNACNTRDTLQAWLDQNHPDHQDPLAYWND